jgi:hypothetical protein
MTTKADFSEQEWEQVLEGPTSAGMIVITAQRGGTFRETISMAKAYAEARQLHGQSELLDAIASTKPKVDHAHAGSLEEVKEHYLAKVRDAVALLDGKASAQELEEYKGFIINLANRVASAHKEGHHADGPISDAEQGAIAAITEALG